MNGIAATEKILDANPHIGIIVLTMLEDDDSVFAAMRAGARGYVLKDADSSEIVAAVHAVARGEALIQPSITRKVLAEFARLADAQRSTPTPLPTTAR